VPAGPEVGRILAELFDRIVENPRLNDRAQLMEIAHALTLPPRPRIDPADPTPVIPPGTAGELSVQLYAVRAALAADLDGTLARLAAIGFTRVEPFDLVGLREGLRDGLGRHGLAAPTAHVGLLDTDLEVAFDTALELGIGTLIQPWTEPSRWQSEAAVREVADEINAIAARAANLGLRVGYHNHHFELASTLDGRHALEVFADLLDPAVVLEVDTYWAFAGGADVPALLRRLGARVVALHLKDGDGSLDTTKQVAVGSGSLPVGAIIEAAPAALRVVELDDTAGNIFEAVRASRANLLAHPELPE
jgi:sugar phosphate isomerase/epimerase